MRKITLALALTCFTFICTAQQQPKLVVGIVVDQMRYDYLTRFWDKFGSDGFKKIIAQGFNCEQAHFNYMPTYTAPGHASIYTGTTPANHGIIANNWYEKETKKTIYCTFDEAINAVGSTGIEGKMSPKNLLVTTITDELKTANKKAKVIGISIKDRGAILPAGHQADAAYWFVGEEEGKWISSSYYMKTLPTWLENLNKKNTANTYLNQTWETLLPINQYTESIADNNTFEGTFKGEQTPTFPHNLPQLRKENKNYDIIKTTPFGNTILKELAFEVIKNEKLGADEITDMLTISFSSTDYVGHQFGPYSVEIEDTYLRLDKEIAELLTYLETNIGKNNFLLFLTADHGVVDIPEHSLENKIPAGYFDEKKVFKKLNKALFEAFNVENLVEDLSNYQIFLNHTKITEQKLNLTVLEDFCAAFLLQQKGIVKAVSATNLKAADFNEKILSNVQRGFHQTRSGDVLFVLASGWIIEASYKGTTHGSPYNYDTHVPLLWYGFHIPQGKKSEPVVIPDIAATLAVLLQIPLPSACDGKPIEAFFK